MRYTAPVLLPSPDKGLLEHSVTHTRHAREVGKCTNNQMSTEYGGLSPGVHRNERLAHRYDFDQVDPVPRALMVGPTHIFFSDA